MDLKVYNDSRQIKKITKVTKLCIKLSLILVSGSLVW